MATETDFKFWISQLDTDDFNDVYCLYKSIDEINEWGAFSSTKKETSRGNLYFVKCTYLDEPLMLLSDKARDYCLDYIQKEYADDMDIESWYGMKYAMTKED